MRLLKTVFIVLLSIALNINDVLAFNNAIAFEKGVTPSSCAAEEAALSSGVGDLKLAAGINPGSLLNNTFNPVATLESALLHGGVGCVGSALSGQSCGSGFVSGSISDLANALTPSAAELANNPLGTASDLLFHGLIGGLAAKLSGGDFATGALSAALQEEFNDLRHLNNTATGLMMGGSLATYCEFGSAGTCTLATPLLIGIPVVVGLGLDTWQTIAQSLMSQPITNNNANDNPPPTSPTPPVTTPASPPPDPNCPEGGCGNNQQNNQPTLPVSKNITEALENAGLSNQPYTDLTTGGSVRNVGINLSRNDFVQQLLNQGFEETLPQQNSYSANNNVVNYTKTADNGNIIKYTVRDYSNYGSPTADYFENNSKKVEIRLNYAK